MKREAALRIDVEILLTHLSSPRLAVGEAR
jgi:hypothetical protein